ncbi:MAG: NUDIX domain-containing protein [Clostridia bacterium]
MRAKFAISTACYLFIDNKVLLIKFSKKWGKKYAPIGGKIEEKESPIECMIREFKEETNCELVSPKLKGVNYYRQDEQEGIIFIYIATKYKGKMNSSEEGKLQWVPIEEISKVEQFEMNSKFTKYLLEEGSFEGKFLLDKDTSVKEYQIRKI